MALTAVAGPGLLEALAACALARLVSAPPAPAQRATDAEDRQSRDTRSPGRSRKDNPAIADGLQPEPGATLRLYNYADYIGPGVVKAFEKKYAVRRQGARLDVQRHRRGADQDPRRARRRSTSTSRATTRSAKMVDGQADPAAQPQLHPQHRATSGRTFSNPWYDGGWRYTVPYTVYTTGIGWRTDQVADGHRRAGQPLRRALGPAVRAASSRSSTTGTRRWRWSRCATASPTSTPSKPADLAEDPGSD